MARRYWQGTTRVPLASVRREAPATGGVSPFAASPVRAVSSSARCISPAVFVREIPQRTLASLVRGGSLLCIRVRLVDGRAALVYAAHWDRSGPPGAYRDP